MGPQFPSRVLAGRDNELSVIAQACTRTAAGHPSALLIGGEAGIGKTRLIAEATSRLPSPALVLFGRCAEYGEEGHAFAPFMALLRQLGVERVSSLLSGQAATELHRLLPGLAVPTSQTSPAFDRARLFEEMLIVFQRLAESGPVILVVEDLQWADRSSRDLFSFLLRSQSTVPRLLVLASYRREELDRDGPLRPLLADLTRLDHVQRIELGPLSKSAVTVQMKALLGELPATGLRDAIFRRSEGNPFFVEALLAGRNESPLPDSIHELLAVPFRRLPVTSRRVVQATAVGGNRVGHSLLGSVVGLSDAALTDAVRPAVTSYLLTVDEDSYSFRHTLLREVVLAELLPGERALLHHRYAEALSRNASSVPPRDIETEAARHWYAIRQQYPDRALESAWRAASYLADSLAHDQRLRLLRQVLSMLGLAPETAGRLGVDRAIVILQATAAAVAVGEGDIAMDLITDGLRDADLDPLHRAQLLRHRGELLQSLGLPGDLDDLRDAAGLLPPGHASQAAILTTLADRLLSVPLEVEGRLVAEQAIRLAAASGDSRAELAGRISIAYARGRSGDVDGQLAILAPIRFAAERSGDDVTLLHVLRCEADLLQGEGRYDEAVEAGQRGLAVAARAGLSRTAGPTHAGNLAEALISLSRWDEAMELLDHALEFDPAPSLRAYLLVLRGSISLHRGDLRSARESVAFARRQFTRGTAYAQDFLLLVRLELDLLLAQDLRAEAVELVERTLAERWPDASSRYLWPVLSIGARLTSSPELRVLAARLPAVGPVQRAHQLQVNAKGTDRPQMPAIDGGGATENATPFGLTRREIEVLCLLAEGYTNRQIAGELFIAVKTVGAHVSNIFTKLGVGGRVQAATIAHQLQLLPGEPAPPSRDRF